MNLISCDSCGVVLDKNKLVFPDMWKGVDDHEEIDTKVAVWTGDGYTSTVQCPVCKERILEEPKNETT